MRRGGVPVSREAPAAGAASVAGRGRGRRNPGNDPAIASAPRGDARWCAAPTVRLAPPTPAGRRVDSAAISGSFA